jgi:glycosyltransferase involved in cell wall biosynthesis
MVVMESMVVGVPVIAPDFGPFPFLVKHRGNGLLYTPDSVEALRDALHQALSEPALLDALCRGARQTGLELREPPMTFSEAVNASFLSSSRLETPSPS